MKVRTMNDYINDIATEIAEEINNNEHSYPQDITAEIVDSYVPIYNHRVIEFATELEGQDWSDVWLGDVEFLDGENIIRQLQINIYNLLYEKVCSHEKIKDLI
jgi:hypothetical protein|tara:strand:- start:175 stop:483 length:309 start_codon:yes stop_codon:yes gene_type:complete